MLKVSKGESLWNLVKYIYSFDTKGKKELKKEKRVTLKNKFFFTLRPTCWLLVLISPICTLLWCYEDIAHI